MTKSSIHESVSLVLIAREKNQADQIYLITRRRDLPIYPGFTAFPGGKLTSEEEKHKSEDLESYLEHGLRLALAREISEELNWAIPSEILKAARYFGASTTPEFWPLRFRNHYLVCQIEHPLNFKIDAGELCQGKWFTFEQFSEMDNLGQFLMVPPTRKAVHAVSFFVASATAPIPHYDLRFDTSHEVPCLEFVKNVWMVLPLSRTFPPANRTNAFILPDANGGHLLIDPSPQDESEFRKLQNTLRRFEVRKILITHHHPDHHQYAPDLARQFDVPLYMSKTTHIFLLKKYGQDYLDNTKIQFLKEGDLLGPFRVYEVPGHDEGQLALAPPSGIWFLAGDLIQTVGTVVIGGEEGDMAKYMSSLQRVIDLNPQIVFPSHGLPMGGTEKIKTTLLHRQQREAQILELYRAGKNDDEILGVVYKGLKPELKKYALKTIEAHFNKLKNEGKL